MDINFQQPFYLLLLIPAIALIIWWWRTQNRVKGKKRYVIAILRLLVFLTLILSLSRLELLFPVKGNTVIFVVDKSASMKNDPRSISFIRDAIDNKREEDKFGIISIGEEAKVEQPITISKEVTPLGAVLNRNATNLAEGIRLASGMIPSNSKGRIVIISDGIETNGDMELEAQFAKERGIIIDAFSLQHELGNEVLLTSLKIPNHLNLNEEFQGTVTLNSSVATKGTLRFYEGNQEIGQKNIEIEKGENSFIFQQKAYQEGFHKYRVELTADKDNISVNNQAYAFTQVRGTPKILVIEGHKGAAANLIQALTAGHLEVEIKDPNFLPKELEDYKRYSTIILSDLQATQISDEDMERIKVSVRDMGLGLIMTGGNDSFGLGGWFKTPIEDALPVYMDIKSKEELPSLGLMLVIDKSGSMSVGVSGLNKMELAKEAALRSTDMLTEKDYIGVVAFDGSPWLVVEPQQAKNLDDIQEKISGIYADGGTDIYPALELAYEKLDKLNTQRKHVILLTDGQSGRDDDYQYLLEEMKKKNITVSTVAIGNDSDTFLLSEIARMGKGRFYFSNDPSTLPKIFSKETALASRTFIVQKPQVPFKLTTDGFPAIQNKLPMLKAYVATTPKQTAELNLLSLDQDPILARWQFGLGRAVAWTSDLEGKWTSDWVTWGNYSQLWNEVVGWTMPQVKNKLWNVETKLDGMDGKITVSIPNGTIPQQMEAIIVNEKMESEKVPLKPIAPGKLQGTFNAKDEGTFMIQVLQSKGDKIVASQTEGLNISYSPEFGLQTNGKDRLEAIAHLTDGKIITSPKDLFEENLDSGWQRQDISKYLIMLAALLWPIDIGVRRVNLPQSLLERLGRIFRRNKNTEAAEQVNNLSHLVKVKQTSKKSSNKNENDSKQLSRQPIIQPIKERKNSRTEEIKETRPNNKTPKDSTKDKDTFGRLLEKKKKK